MSDPIQQDIQQQLSELDSELDLVAVERPEGIDLARCEQVTRHLSHLLVDYALEVSSPGPKYSRPSTASETKESPQ